MIKLSIITTVYNSANYLEKCLNSLLNQDIPFTDYEIIVVDDGSPDNSAELARSYAEHYPNIRIISHENRGTGEARNTGIKTAKGKYLVIIDPDDYVQPNVYKNLFEKMESGKLDMLRFGYKLVDSEYKELPMPKGAKNTIDYQDSMVDGKTFLAKRLGYACFVWSYIYRTEILQRNQLYFRPRFYIDDTEWLPRVLLCVERITSIQTQVVYYVQHAGSLMNTNAEIATLKKLEGCFTAIEMLQSEFKKHTDKKVKNWYKGMISVLVMGSLQVITSLNTNKSDYLYRLKRMCLFPLSYYRQSQYLKIKIFLVNISPELYCKLAALKK